MKKFSFLALAAVGLLLAGCTDKEAVSELSNANSLQGQGQGYFKVSISMPSSVSTRGADSDVWNEDDEDPAKLDDGDGQEYAVENALLLLFEGSTETTARLKQTITLSNTTSMIGDEPNHITEDVAKNYVAKLDAAPAANLYALAVINGTKVIEAGTATNKIKVLTNELEAPTIGDLQAAIASSSSVSENDFIYTSSNDSKQYFFMTNAVLFNNQGGNVRPVAEGATIMDDWHILAPVDANNIYLTESEATQGNPATDIYVERGVAKVTITKGTKWLQLNDGIKTKDGGTAPTVTFNGWTLDNTNTQSYVVRQVPEYAEAEFDWNFTSFAATSQKYRFVGGYPVDGYYGTQNAGFRTYWALDPNYSSDGTFSSASTIANAQTDKLYCFENTFDVEHQIFKETTRALVQITFSGGDFYTIGADKKTLYSFDDVKKLVATDLLSQSAFATAMKGHENSEYTVTYDKLTITFDKTTAGVLNVKSVTVDKSAWTTPPASDFTITDATTDANKSIIETLNNQLSRVEYFKGGVSYYQIRIKHFGDVLTPWKNGEYKVDANHPEWVPAESTIETIYPDADDNRQAANYLGRYGMVRNNWYELEINEIMRVGSATVPELTDHPDDELEDLYIKARINVLSWAKRPQSWTLK